MKSCNSQFTSAYSLNHTFCLTNLPMATTNVAFHSCTDYCNTISPAVRSYKHTPNANTHTHTIWTFLVDVKNQKSCENLVGIKSYNIMPSTTKKEKKKKSPSKWIFNEFPVGRIVWVECTHYALCPSQVKYIRVFWKMNQMMTVQSFRMSARFV